MFVPYGTLLFFSILQRRQSDSSTMFSRAPLGFNTKTRGWFKKTLRGLSLFPLELVVVMSMTAVVLFITSCVFDSALAYLTHRQSEKPIGRLWIRCFVAPVRLCRQLSTQLNGQAGLSQKRYASGVLDADKLYGSRAVILAVPSKTGVAC